MTVPCSDGALTRGDQLAATASRVDRWLLVEQPGPWGPPALPTARLPTDVARHLVATARAAGARLLLIRRHRRSTGDGRRAYIVDSRPGHEQVLTTVASDLMGLLDLGLDGGGWTPVPDPLLLVCTHGRHDRCCAVRGRPVAEALLTAWPNDTWECSHVGGDRFAANLLVLPAGLYFGQLSPDEALDVVSTLAAGRLPLDRLRGRSTGSTVVQAAEHFARTALDRDRLDDLATGASEHLGAGRWRVVLAGSGGRPAVAVTLTAVQAPAARLTCGAIEDKVALTYACEHVTVLPAVSWSAD